MKRWAVATAILLGLVVTAAGGWAAARLFVSPEQRQAAASPPPPAAVVVPVELDVLAEDITLRADIRPGGDVPLRLRATGDGDAYVTANPVPVGSEVAPGAVVSEVNGRPVLVVPGAFPFYRDLGPGDTGPDVAQLQEALRATGRTIRVRENGTYGADTSKAVAALYRAAGYAQAKRTPTDQGAEQRSATSEQSGEEKSAPVVREQAFVPAAEFLTASTLPARLAAAPGVGAAVTAESTIVLTTGSLSATADVPRSVFERLSPGMTVRVHGPGGEVLEGTTPDNSAVVPNADGVFRISLGTLAIPDEWRDQNLLTTVTLAATSAPELVVPTRAVATGLREGAGSVLKERADGTFVAVEVEVIASLGGVSAVRPVAEDGLAAGDTVRVDEPRVGQER